MTTTLAPPTFADELAAHRAYLLRVARQRLRDEATAEDLVSETLLAAMQGAQAFAERSTLRTWLTGILLKRVADHQRRELRSPVAYSTDNHVDEDDEDDAAERLPDHRDPLHWLQLRESMQQLAASLEDLPPLARDLFELREMEGLENDEAAARLGITPARSALAWHRAKVRLRERLAAA